MQKKRVILIGDQNKKGVDWLVKSLTKEIKKNIQLVAVDLNNSLDLSKIHADLIIVLGGDGAILATARRLENNYIPVVGINLGKFGFLATYSSSEWQGLISHIINHKIKGSSRMMLNCKIIRKGKALKDFIALNDAVITRGAISRMIYLKLYINEKELATFGADGIIISTPVGSTAHSLAAGGPIVEPSLKSLIITPICPHTLSMRPLVIPPGEEITVEITSEAKEVVLTIDGQIFKNLRSDDRVKISSGKHSFYLVEPPHVSFYDTLREKLNWGKRDEN